MTAPTFFLLLINQLVFICLFCKYYVSEEMETLEVWSTEDSEENVNDQMEGTLQPDIYLNDPRVV